MPWTEGAHSATYRSDGSPGHEGISGRFPPDGKEVDCYRLYAFVDGVSLSAESDKEGYLTEPYYYGSNQTYTGNQEESCEISESLDLSPWPALDLDRLVPA